jgi:hypothetical protein
MRVLGLLVLLLACDDSTPPGSDGGRDDGSVSPRDGGAPRNDAVVPRSDGGVSMPPSRSIDVAVSAGAGGVASLGLPFGVGWTSSLDGLRVVDEAGSAIELAASVLATHPDGSIRSALVQFSVPAGDATYTIELGDGAAPTGAIVPVESLLGDDGLPRVWATLPSEWLAESRVVGPLVPFGAADPPLDAWERHCEYAAYAESTDTGNNTWLYDRTTVYVRAYAQSGSLALWQAAYRAGELYRSRITGSGAETRIGIGTVGDVKYHYTQNMAALYLLTGDERFRDAAIGVATRLHELHDPTYDGDDGFWTERNAGFAILGYVHAMIVAGDGASMFRTWADEAVDAALEVQATYPDGYDDAVARCFAHSCEAHDPEECDANDTHYFGCSPWMSAILAEGLDTYATEVGGERAAAAHRSLAELGRILVRDAIVPDTDGRPYYWMGVGPGAGAGYDDGYEEHRGEVAYVAALGYARDGSSDDAYRAGALDLVRGFSEHGVVPHVRSLNWQCRAAVATPALLAPP